SIGWQIASLRASDLIGPLRPRMLPHADSHGRVIDPAAGRTLRLTAADRHPPSSEATDCLTCGWRMETLTVVEARQQFALSAKATCQFVDFEENLLAAALSRRISFTM